MRKSRDYRANDLENLPISGLGSLISMYISEQNPMYIISHAIVIHFKLLIVIQFHQLTVPYSCIFQNQRVQKY